MSRNLTEHDKELFRVKNDLGSLENSNLLLKEEISKKTLIEKDHKEKMLELQSNLVSQRNQCQEMQKQLSEKTQEVLEVKGNNKQLHQLLSECNGKLEKLENEKRELIRCSGEDSKKTKSHLQDLNKKIEHHLSNENRLKIKLDQIEQECSQKQEEIQKLSHSVSETEKCNQKLVLEQKEYKSQNLVLQQDLNHYQKEMQRLNQTVIEKELEINQSKLHLSNLKDSSSFKELDIKKKIESLQQENSLLKNAFDSLQVKASKARSDAEERIKELILLVDKEKLGNESLKKTLDSKHSEIEKMNSEKKEISEKSLQSALDSIKLKEKIEHLEKKLELIEKDKANLSNEHKLDTEKVTQNHRLEMEKLKKEFSEKHQSFYQQISEKDKQITEMRKAMRIETSKLENQIHEKEKQVEELKLKVSLAVPIPSPKSTFASSQRSVIKPLDQIEDDFSPFISSNFEKEPPLISPRKAPKNKKKPSLKLVKPSSVSKKSSSSSKKKTAPPLIDDDPFDIMNTSEEVTELDKIRKKIIPTRRYKK